MKIFVGGGAGCVCGADTLRPITFFHQYYASAIVVCVVIVPRAVT